MGTKMAPAYANIFKGKLEGQLLRTVKLKPFSWLRFIDDIDMKWGHNLQTFLEEATSNNFHPTIKFTAETYSKNHVFLDTNSTLVGDSIQVDLYTKPTDTHQYLLPTSCHPKHICRNIPYCLALRIRRICSTTDAFENRAKELTSHLKRRGYYSQEISAAIAKARSHKREDLLSYRPKEESTDTTIPFVMTYHPELPKVKEIVNRHWSIIDSSERLRKVFPKKPVMAYRRPKSLRDLLVKARLPQDPMDNTLPGESKPCGGRACSCCKVMTPTQARQWSPL